MAFKGRPGNQPAVKQPLEVQVEPDAQQVPAVPAFPFIPQQTALASGQHSSWKEIKK